MRGLEKEGGLLGGIPVAASSHANANVLRDGDTRGNASRFKGALRKCAGAPGWSRFVAGLSLGAFRQGSRCSRLLADRDCD
jgi:hypothetical protein